jgi:hypothetical protein
LNESQPLQKILNPLFQKILRRRYLLILFSLSSQAAFAQDFSSIDNDLQTLAGFYANSDSGDGGN